MNFLLVKLNHHCRIWFSIFKGIRGDGSPHLARSISFSVYPVQQSVGQLLSHLTDVLSQDFGLVSVSRRLECLVEGECSIAGDGEVCVEGKVHDGLLGLSSGHLRLDLLDDFTDEQDAVDENAVGGTLDFEVAKEGVGAEQGQRLVQRVVAFV